MHPKMLYRSTNFRRRAGLSAQAFTALLLAATAGLHATFAQAEIYRVIDENGNISFSDKPPAGAAAEKVEIDENAQNSSLSSEAIEERQPDWLREAQEKRRAEEASKRAAAPSAAEMSAWRESLANAKQKLRDAKQAQEQGIVVSEGDFIGKAGGGVRPSQQYHEKLEKLDQDVIDAKAQLDAVRNAKPR
ncbi:MAG: DUF4124 domain-containing protein [Pseudomonadales bacterium]|nr:DUF4124 domain-containing protein [Pseudomonadales bacterium]NNL11933.1 DUF4124 domain-containing protein [Pseudomonadales bacterium]